MKDKIIIVGGGGHSKVLINILYKLQNYDIVGYTDVENKGDILGVKYLGNDNILSDIIIREKKCFAAIGVGMVNINTERENIFNRVKSIGFEFPQIISPVSTINRDVIIGEGSVVFDGVVINPGTKIGKGCIINTNSTIEHDCIIEDFSQICPGATLSGGVRVGRHCLIGTGSSVKQYLKITDYCVIGVGSAVIKNCEKSGVYIGTPARKRI